MWRGCRRKLRQLLTRRLDTLPAATRRVLDVASVVGQEFAVAAVAAGAPCPVDDVEAVCDRVSSAAALLEGHRADGVAGWD